MTFSKLLLSVALLLGVGFAGQTTLAQAPTGSITNYVSASTNSLWDASLMWTDLNTNSWDGSFAVFAGKGTNALQVSLTNFYTLNGQGRLLGRGTNDLIINRFVLTSYLATNQVLQVQTNLGVVETNLVEKTSTNFTWTDVEDIGPLVATYQTTGSVTGTKGNAIAQFRNSSRGQVLLDGVTRRITTTKAYWVAIPANGSTLQGSFANLIALTGQRQYALGGPFRPFNPFNRFLDGGRWTLVLTFDPPSATAANRLTGTATVTLSSQAVYSFQFTGRYIPTLNQSQLLLKGVQGQGDAAMMDARGATLSLTLGSDGKILKMLGRIAGQALLQK